MIEKIEKKRLAILRILKEANKPLPSRTITELLKSMAGARKFKVDEITRGDIFSANRETESETGIPFITDVMDDRAKEILAG